jgi:cellulose biosynthesis protein BcsQ
MTTLTTMRRKNMGDAYVFTTLRRKGGIGTTTMQIALATGLAARGYAVLILEGDDNRRLSRIMLGLDEDDAPPVQDSQTVYHLFTHPEEGIGNAPFEVDIPSMLLEIGGHRDAILMSRGWTHPQPLRIVPGSESLRLIESDLIYASRAGISEFQSYTRLATAISMIRQDFDFIFIDTPSMLSLITMNEAMAARHALFLADSDPDSRHDFWEAHKFYRRVVANCQSLGVSAPEPFGVILNKDTRSVYDQALFDAYTQEHYDKRQHRIVPPLLPYPVIARWPFDEPVVKRSMYERRPVHVTDPLSGIGVAMDELCVVVEEQLGLRPALGAAR